LLVQAELFFLSHFHVKAEARMRRRPAPHGRDSDVSSALRPQGQRQWAQLGAEVDALAEQFMYAPKK
jgi:hypothetical protein